MRDLIILRVILVVCFGCIPIWYGCNGGNGNSSQLIFVTFLDVMDSNGEETSEFSSGEEIQFELNIMNTSRSPHTLGFGSGQQYDFFVRKAGNSNIIWRWSDHRLFTQAQTTLAFDSGERKTFTEPWVQTDNDEALVEPGLYEAQGVIVDQSGLPDEFCSSWVTFEIM